MRIIISTFLITIICTGLFTTNLKAQDKPIQVALFNPVQIFPENNSITGLRLNILYGKNSNVSGIDWVLLIQQSGNKLVCK